MNARKVLPVLVLAAALSSASCAVLRAPVVPPVGAFYSDFHAPLDTQVQGKELGSKRGEASTTNWFGFVSIGNASIQAAAENAGITQVSHADYHFFNVLGFFSKFTVFVYGE